MKGLSQIFNILFPIPQRWRGKGKHNFIKKQIFIAALFFSYSIIFMDFDLLLNTKINFADTIGFSHLKNYLNSSASLVTGIFAIFMIHLLSYLQEEAPDDKQEYILFNGFLVFVFMMMVSIKSSIFDPHLKSYLYEKKETKLLKSLNVSSENYYYQQLKNRILKNRFKLSKTDFDILCELNLYDGCISLSEHYSEKKGNRYYWALRRAVKIKSSESKILNRLAWSMMTDKNFKANNEEKVEAFHYAQKAVELNPESHYYNDTLAYAYFLKKDCERAKTYQFLAIMYLDKEIVRKPSSELKDDYELRLQQYEECRFEENL